MKDNNKVALNATEIQSYSSKLENIKEGLENLIKKYSKCLENFTDSSLFSGAMIEPLQNEASLAEETQVKLSALIDGYIEFLNNNVAEAQELDEQIAQKFENVEPLEFGSLVSSSEENIDYQEKEEFIQNEIDSNAYLFTDEECECKCNEDNVDYFDDRIETFE